MCSGRPTKRVWLARHIAAGDTTHDQLMPGHRVELAGCIGLPVCPTRRFPRPEVDVRDASWLWIGESDLAAVIFLGSPTLDLPPGKRVVCGGGFSWARKSLEGCP